MKGVAALAAALAAVLATTASAAPRPHVERAQAGAVAAVFTYAWDAPRFRFTVNNRRHVTRDYGYWVENQLRERFGLEGVPVTIDFVPRS